MARKTTGTSTTRSKKAPTSIQPTAVLSPEIPQNGKSASVVPIRPVPSNLEEEIRCRAYELYVQRGGNGNGDEGQDWLVAEREIRSRYGLLARHTTA
ncbi:MAG: DUF2934 domain-containing protein [Terriglobales bacterium]|jgi:hypothetical protein